MSTMKHDSRAEFGREIVEYGLGRVGRLAAPADPVQIALALGLRIVAARAASRVAGSGSSVPKFGLLIGDAICVPAYDGDLRLRIAEGIAQFLLRDQGVAPELHDELYSHVTTALLAYDETKRGQRLAPAQVIDIGIARRLARAEAACLYNAGAR